MHGEENSVQLTTKALIIRLVILVGVSLILYFSSSTTGALNSTQAIACSVFIGIILGTLFFWNFRLAIAFIGLSVLIGTKFDEYRDLRAILGARSNPVFSRYDDYCRSSP